MTVTFRDLRGMAEFRRAEALQRAVWGEGDKEDPADLMMVIQHEGGLAAGAFRDGELLGYVFGFPTVTPGVQHSHRLAVLGSARGLGLGAKLKWYQRDWCLARGITHVRWTFDPLRLANANLNIARLGAQVATYLPDYYGDMEGINSGTPSDRLMADWHLASPAVTSRAAGCPVDLPARIVARVAIPADFDRLLALDLAAAADERVRVREALQRLLGMGLKIRGFEVESRCYLLAAAE